MSVEMIETKINGRWPLKLPKHRAERPEWATGWEVKRIHHMMKTISQTDVIFDIGAEEGDMSALFARQAKGSVLFEPNPRVWPNIKAIWEANNIKKPFGYFVGFASNDDVLVPHQLDFDNTVGEDGWPKCANGPIIGDHGFRELARQGTTTPQIRLDTFVDKYGIAPDIITMDVEGSELEVLRGAKMILKKIKPMVYVSIHPEFMFEMFDYWSANLFSYMWDLGYSHEVLDFDHEWHVRFWHPEGR